MIGSSFTPLQGLALLVGLLLAVPVVAEEKAEKYWVYVGTYTRGGPSKGIYRFELDGATGTLTPRGLAGEATNPSYVAIHPSRRFLYAVSEVPSFSGSKGGAVSAFALDPQSGNLTLLNQQPSGGAGPCYVTVDRAGKNVLAANYGGGSESVFPVGPDGRLGRATAFVQNYGSSVNKKRQEGPHAHSINLDFPNHFAFVADLGLDKILILRFDPRQGTLTPNDPSEAKVAPSSGPRHFAFHPSGRFAYVINEMSNTITAFAYDPKRGALTDLQTISTLPPDFHGTSYCADIHVHPSGKFVYGSNRGHDSIAVFTVDPAKGTLTAVEQQGQGIKTPRNFALDPTGNWMLVANQDGNDIVVFQIDAATGALKPTGKKVEVPKPVCVQMMPAPR